MFWNFMCSLAYRILNKFKRYEELFMFKIYCGVGFGQLTPSDLRKYPAPFLWWSTCW